MAAAALLLACIPLAAAASEPADASHAAAKTQPAPHHGTSNSGTHKTPSHQSPTAKSGAAKTSTTKSSKAKSSPSHKSKKSKTTTSAHHGQQKIEPERAQRIQQALVREHYLDGAPTGQWDDASQKAMEKFQADNGWQSKVVPDSRALIKLGLGPNQDHLLNPETAMTAVPARPTSSALTDVPQPVPTPQK